MKKNNGSKKSSTKVNEFLEKNNLHKKDFAQMIGVTLSYVYNIIDESIPFSTRSTTIERIATVMDIMPEEFEEYVIEEDPTPYNKSLEVIKNYIKENKMTVVEFLKFFERKKRLKMVDILRGYEPLPINYQELKTIKDILHIDDDSFYKLWEEIFINYLEKGGFEKEKNECLLNVMLKGANKFFLSSANEKCNIS